MALDLAGVVTCATNVSGLTNPTYTLVEDRANDTNARQFYVSALGGTQTGVETHSVRRPFTVTAWRPKNLVQPGSVDPTTGLLRTYGKNVSSMLIRTALRPVNAENPRPMMMKIIWEVPAGGEFTDMAQLRAVNTLAGGLFWAQGSNLNALLTHAYL